MKKDEEGQNEVEREKKREKKEKRRRKKDFSFFSSYVDYGRKAKKKRKYSLHKAAQKSPGGATFPTFTSG